MTHVTANTTNAGFRLYADDVAGAVTAQTALAGANANATIDTGVKFHAALRFNENAGADASVTPRLEYNLAGGGWNDVTTTTPIQAVAATNCTTTDAASYGTTALSNGATVSATQYDNNASDGTSRTLNNSAAEYTTCLRIDSAQVTDGQTFQLRISNAGGALNADTTLTTITINVPAVSHDATGTLSAGTGALAGSAARADPVVSHDATGALSAGTGSLAGTSARERIRDATGTLSGGSGTLSGSASRERIRDASGALSGGTGALSGAASRTGGAVSHDATGALSGGAGSLSGAAVRSRAHSATGALVAGSGALLGSAGRSRMRDASGALNGAGAALAGSAARVAAGPVTHAATGVLAAGAELVGAADITRTGYSPGQLIAWAKFYRGSRRAKG